MLDQICKYKIGQLLTLEADEHFPTRQRFVMRVKERLVQECYGGVQVHYDCRIHTCSPAILIGTREPVPGILMLSHRDDTTHRFTEHELVPFDEAKFAEQFKEQD